MKRAKKRKPRERIFTEQILFRITPLMRERLEMVAQKVRRPVVWVVREMVSNALARIDGRPVEKRDQRD